MGRHNSVDPSGLTILGPLGFKSKHNSKEINPTVWKRASVKSASNCMACHGAADKGDFNERNIRIPQ